MTVTVPTSDEFAALSTTVAGLATTVSQLAAKQGADEQTEAAAQAAQAIKDATQDAEIAALEPPPPPPPPPAPAPPPAPSARFPGDPGIGKLLYGEGREGNEPALEAREATYGQAVQLHRSYWQAAQASSLIAQCQTDQSKGRLPLVSTKLAATWADVAAGKQDGWLTGLLDGLGKLAGPVWLCLHHEPYDNQGAGQTPADYKAMYAHAKTLKPANVALMPILQSQPWTPDRGGKLTDITPWYDPASADLFGFDAYNAWFPNGTKGWTTPEQSCSAMIDLFAALDPSTPAVLAEYGCRVDPANPGKAGAWMADAYTYLLGRGVVGMSYFDSAQNIIADGGTFELSGETLDAFKAALLTSAS